MSNDTTTPPAPAGEEPIVDAHVVDATADEVTPASPAPSTALAVTTRPDGNTELIQASSPEELVEKATAIATSLDLIIRKQGLRTKVGSQKKLDPKTGEPVSPVQWEPKWHVDVEGWQTLATLLGLAVVPQEPRPITDPITGVPVMTSFEVHEKTYHPKNKGGGLKAERDYVVQGYDWRCRVEVFKNGSLVGAGESVCRRTEERWKDADDYAVMGMAQTRGTSRAIGAAARWIVALAGYSATPSEEMTEAMAGEPDPGAAAAVLPGWAKPASPALMKTLRTAMGWLLDDKPDGEKVNGVGAEIIGTTDGRVTVAAAKAVVLAIAARKKLDETPDPALEGETPPPGAGVAEHEPTPAPTPGKTPGSVQVALTDPNNIEKTVAEWKAAGCICADPTTMAGRSTDCPIYGHAITL